MSAARPPRLAGVVARLLLPRERAARLLADLDEEYRDYQRATKGRVAADLWYWRQVVGSTLALGIARIAKLSPTVSGVSCEGIIHDTRYAVRGLRRSPTFTLSAILTLGLGIGATTAIFSVVHAVLLRSLPYDDADRIVRAWDHTSDGSITDFSFRVVEYEEVHGRTGTFETVGAEFPISATVLVDGQEPRQVQGRMVTSDLFRVFGIEPPLGRMFTDQEIAGGDQLLVVVSHGFWTRYLGADPAALGRSIDLNGRAYVLIGVLPEGYRHVSGSDAQVFIPYTIGTRGWIGHWLDLYALVRPGISHDRAAEEINSALVAVGASDRASDRWYATVEGLHEMVVGDVRTPIWAVLATVVLVMLLTCVNVANLTLARATSRLSEVGVRASLGAGRGRLLAQLLVENGIVAVLGGVVGVVAAWASLGLLVRLAPASIPRIGDAAIDPIVLGFSLLLTAMTPVAFGLGPAIWMSRRGAAVGPARAARGETGGRGLHRALGGLVVAEITLAITLLTAAGLTLRTLQHLNGEELGIERSRAVAFRIIVPASRYPSAAEAGAFYARLREALGALDGVTAVGAVTDLPVSGEGAVATVTTEERVAAGAEEGVTVLQRRATAGLFRAFGTPVLEGREFDARDRPDGERVVIVSESLARTLFGEERAVGRLIGWGAVPQEDDWMRIVGVVGDVHYENVEREPDPQVYQAHAQSTTREMAVVVRTAGDPLEYIEPARAVLRRLDPMIPAYDVSTLGGLVDVALAGRRFTATLFGLFAGVALVLTVAGLYGVLAFVVGQRRREIGVRVAVGASAASVTALVLRRGATLLVVGAAFGLGGGLLAGRLLRGLLVGVPPFDPRTFLVVGAVIVCVGGIACLVPALGASRVDPLEALREG